MSGQQNAHTRLLIVDDESAFRTALMKSLSSAGFRVFEASTGEEALAALARHPVDIALLDINMPGMGGVETCRRVSELHKGVGIVMVTVRDSEDDKVEALESGADDFITKPFLFRELVARVRAVHRRRLGAGGPRPTLIKAGQLEVDLTTRVLRKAGVEIHLSPTEFDVLTVLIQNQDAPVTHKKLLRTVWGPEYGGELEYLRSYIKMLRKKIEDDPSNPQYILTEPWAGYRFRNPADPDAPQPAEEDE